MSYTNIRLPHLNCSFTPMTDAWESAKSSEPSVTLTGKKFLYLPKAFRSFKATFRWSVGHARSVGWVQPCRTGHDYPSHEVTMHPTQHFRPNETIAKKTPTCDQMLQRWKSAGLMTQEEAMKQHFMGLPHIKFWVSLLNYLSGLCYFLDCDVKAVKKPTFFLSLNPTWNGGGGVLGGNEKFLNQIQNHQNAF